jgi:trigger factor
VAKLVEGHPFELPESLVARRTEQLMSEVADDWRARRVWPKDEAAAFASLRDELTPRARSQVHATVVLDAIGRQEHIEVTDDDIEEEIERSAAAAGNAADRLRSLFARPEAREGLRERLRRQRVLDLVIDQARVTTVEFPPPNVAGEGESR